MDVKKGRNREQLPDENDVVSSKKPKLQLPLEPFVSSLSHHVDKAWDYWRKLGQPKLMVAPMVDQSELPFRMLCRKYGATAAYTPMLHSRLFSEDSKYRDNEFTTCPEDRPLLVQFCANHPETLLSAAKFVEDHCDYVDINFGCPQRIAKRGRYGAFLMDDLPLIHALVSKLAGGLKVPVSCKIRVFPNLEGTISYAKMLESAGCSLLAVHGRTREQKCARAAKADWDVIRAVRKAVKIPVLGNGNVRWLEDVHKCMEETGVEGVLSAESLLENPALFGGYRIVQPPAAQASEKKPNGVVAEVKASEVQEQAEVRTQETDDVVLTEQTQDEKPEAIIQKPDVFQEQTQAEARAQSLDVQQTEASNGILINTSEERSADGDEEKRVKYISPVKLLLDYLDLCEKYPVPPRMIRAHVHKLLGNWFKVHPDLRQRLNNENKPTLEWLRNLATAMQERMHV